jgi:NADH:ubiquinone oxidoreductase subunit 4 (subunit M)
MTISEALIYINTNYSNLLAVIVALLTSFITLAYVIMAYKQVKLSESSIESIEKQIKLNNQPCIIPKITKTIGTECFTETRRQLHIEIN